MTGAQSSKLKAQSYSLKLKIIREAKYRSFALCALRFALLPRRTGFTLLELLISVAVLAILTTFIVSGLSAYRETSALDQAVDETLELLREARAKTLASEGAMNHGIYFASSSVTLFQGGAYTPGVPSNTVVALPPGVTVSSVLLSTTTASVVFERLTGESPSSGTVTFTTARSGKTKQIEILTSGAFRKL